MLDQRVRHTPVDAARHPHANKTTHRYHSAQLTCWNALGVAHGSYSGLMTQAACEYLGTLFYRQSRPQPSVVHLYPSITLPFSESHCVKNLLGTPPGCYVVRPDQFDQVLALTVLLRPMGVHRLVFLQEHLQIALQWSASANN